MTDGIRYTTDLININERERDIIINWAQAAREEDWVPGSDTLLKRFTDWKEAEEVWKRRKAKAELDARQSN